MYLQNGKEFINRLFAPQKRSVTENRNLLVCVQDLGIERRLSLLKNYQIMVW